jgi:hypothetical protein
VQVPELAQFARAIGQFIVGEMPPDTISERMIRLLPVLSNIFSNSLLSKTFSQRSKVTPACGWEQHTSTFPGAGLSSGSGL